ncbi:MAG: hypothetical protein K9L95_06490 [Candidatus Omnitrophica bacterium]|nr:hypothetical protein [Candidatus Omnitrophota bacterium]
MQKINRKKIIITFLFLIVINFAIIFSSIKSGQADSDPMYRFRERQAVTFLSALTLGLTGLTALFTYLLKKKTKPLQEKDGFWLFSAIGFFYLCLDEYFMAHEGIDEWVGSWFGKNIKAMNLDNLVIAFFGIIAFSLCLYFRKVIFKNKIMLPFLAIGGLGLIGTVIFHSFEKINVYYEVAEESFKLVGVTSFFAAYLISFLSFRNQIFISSKK